MEVTLFCKKAQDLWNRLITSLLSSITLRVIGATCLMFEAKRIFEVSEFD